LDSGDVGQLLEEQTMLLTGFAHLLPFQDAGCRHGRHSHAITDKVDHILGPVPYWAEFFCGLYVLLAGIEPVGYRFWSLYHRLSRKRRTNQHR